MNEEEIKAKLAEAAEQGATEEQLGVLANSLLDEFGEDRPDKFADESVLEQAIRVSDIPGGTTRSALLESLTEAGGDIAETFGAEDTAQKLRDFITDKDIQAGSEGVGPTIADFLERAGVPEGETLRSGLQAAGYGLIPESALPAEDSPFNVTARGLAGFAGDVLTDPTSYAFGAGIFSRLAALAGKGIAVGAKGVSGAASSFTKYLASRALKIDPKLITKYADRFDAIQGLRGTKEFSDEVTAFARELNKDVEAGVTSVKDAKRIFAEAEKKLTDVKSFKTQEAKDVLGVEKFDARKASDDAKAAFIKAENQVVADLNPEIPEHIQAMHDQFIKKSQEAADLLPVDEVVFDVDGVLKEIDDQIATLEVGGGPLFETQKSQANGLRRVKERLESFKKNQTTDGLLNTQTAGGMNGPEVKKLLRAMDDELFSTTVSSGIPKKQQKLWKVRKFIDDDIKGRYDAYKEVVGEAHKLGTLRDETMKVFKTPEKSKSVLQKLNDPRNATQIQAVENIKNSGGPDYKRLLEERTQKEAIELAATKQRVKELANPRLRQKRLAEAVENAEVEKLASKLDEESLKLNLANENLVSSQKAQEMFPQLRPNEAGDVRIEDFIRSVGADDPNVIKTSDRLSNVLGKDITQEAVDQNILGILAEPQSKLLGAFGTSPKGVLDKVMPAIKASRATGKLADTLGVGSGLLLGKTLPRRTLIELLTQKDEPQVPLAR